MKKFVLVIGILLSAYITIFGNEKKIVDLKTIWSPVSVTFRLVDKDGNMEYGSYTTFFAPFYTVVSVVDKTTGVYNKKVPKELVKDAARYSYMSVDFGIGGGLLLGLGVFPLIVFGAVFMGVSNLFDYRTAFIAVGATFLVLGILSSITGIIFIIVAGVSYAKCKEKKKEIIDILNSVKSGMNIYKDDNLRVSFDLNLAFQRNNYLKY